MPTLAIGADQDKSGSALGTVATGDAWAARALTSHVITQAVLGAVDVAGAWLAALTFVQRIAIEPLLASTYAKQFSEKKRNMQWKTR